MAKKNCRVRDRRDPREQRSKNRNYQTPDRDTANRWDRVERNFRKAPTLKAKNRLQAQYIEAMESTPITIATGYPGSGKTYLAGRMAGAWLKERRVDTIILARPAVSTSESLGFFKGTIEEKMQGWLAPVMGALKDEFSPGELSYLIKETIDRLVFVPLEVIKGYSWKNSFIIVDEVEDCTLKELRSIVTRIGVNSRLVLSGDISQTDLASSGVAELLTMRKHDNALARHIAHINFNDPSTIVRSDTCREMILAFERAGK